MLIANMPIVAVTHRFLIIFISYYPLFKFDTYSCNIGIFCKKSSFFLKKLKDWELQTLKVCQINFEIGGTEGQNSSVDLFIPLIFDRFIAGFRRETEMLF